MQAAVLTQNTILDVHSMMNDIARAKDALAHECKLREVTLDDKYTARSKPSCGCCSCRSGGTRPRV
jgi:hypothetical protein